MRVAGLALSAALIAGDASATTMVTIGDSITQGQLPSGDPGPTYAELLAEEFSLVNLGCGGATVGNWHPFAFPMGTCGGLPGAEPNLFVARVLPNTPVDYAVVMLGVVDAAWGTDPAVYDSLLGDLVAGLHTAGAQTVVLLTPTPWPDFAGGDAGKTALLQGYRAAVMAECQQRENVICVDIYGRFEPLQFFLYSPNDPHPHSIGHRMIASAVLLALPEPGTAVLIAAGLIALARLRPLQAS